MLWWNAFRQKVTYCEKAAVCSMCYCYTAGQMFKCTVGHVCRVCGFFLSLPAAKHSCTLEPQETSDLYLQTVCMCVCDIVRVSLWTNMNSGSAEAFMYMETKWEKFYRNCQLICLCFHSSSLCLCLIRSISVPLYMTSKSLGSLMDSGLTCQVSHLWRTCWRYGWCALVCF